MNRVINLYPKLLLIWKWSYFFLNAFWHVLLLYDKHLKLMYLYWTNGPILVKKKKKEERTKVWRSWGKNGGGFVKAQKLIIMVAQWEWQSIKPDYWHFRSPTYTWYVIDEIRWTNIHVLSDIRYVWNKGRYILDEIRDRFEVDQYLEGKYGVPKVSMVLGPLLEKTLRLFLNIM